MIEEIKLNHTQVIYQYTWDSMQDQEFYDSRPYS